jgi:hypothetical protein
MSQLLVGSDRRTLVATSASREGPFAAPTAVPAGTRHALPEGKRLALCGLAPAIAWTSIEWPGIAHDEDLCPECRVLAKVWPTR